MTFAAISGGSILGLSAAVLLTSLFFGIAVGRFLKGLPPDDIRTDTPLDSRSDRLPGAERSVPVEAPLPLRGRSSELRALPRPPRNPAREARRR